MRVLISAIITAMLTMAQNKPSVAIVGGDYALEGEFPAYVTITVNSKLHCGGTIIADDQILTAASCLFDDDGKPIEEASILVVRPTNNQRPTKAEIENQGVEVARKCISKLYTAEYDYGYDMAILKLSQPYDLWRRDVEVADLPYYPLNLADIWSVGMGSVTKKLPSLYPHYLQKIGVESWVCGNHIHSSYLCLRPPSGEKGGVAHEDRGGGAFIKQKDGRQLLVGVIAKSRHAKEECGYDLYTNVQSLRRLVMYLREECGDPTNHQPAHQDL